MLSVVANKAEYDMFVAQDFSILWSASRILIRTILHMSSYAQQAGAVFDLTRTSTKTVMPLIHRCVSEPMIQDYFTNVGCIFAFGLLQLVHCEESIRPLPRGHRFITSLQCLQCPFVIPPTLMAGKVCLSILGTWDGPSWSPSQTLGSVLLSIQVGLA